MPIWKQRTEVDKEYRDRVLRELVGIEQDPKDWERSNWVVFLLCAGFDIETITKFLADDGRFVYD